MFITNNDRKEFDRNLLRYQKELTEENPVAERKDYYERFFTCKRTPQCGLKVAFNWPAVEAARKQYVGFSAIMTTRLEEPAVGT